VNTLQGHTLLHPRDWFKEVIVPLAEEHPTFAHLPSQTVVVPHIISYRQVSILETESHCPYVQDWLDTYCVQQYFEREADREAEETIERRRIERRRKAFEELRVGAAINFHFRNSFPV
jgi:hypothetical protein